MPTPERPVSDEEYSRAGMALARRFIQRWDVYPLQLDDGSYVCIHEPLTTSHILAHLRGEITLGTYLLNQDSQARFMVLDADTNEAFRQLVHASVSLIPQGIPGYLERSRRGGHLWFFFEQPVPGTEVRAFGKWIIASRELQRVELYPRQDRLSQGPGSLIRLPFGIHRKSGVHYGFYTPNGKPLAPSLMQQAIHFGNVRTVSKTMLSPHQIASNGPVEQKPPMIALPTNDPLSKRIKESVSVREFISRYVELSPSGVGKCPFHDDEHVSFSVNGADNYWHCFAGCGGGSVVDFWMKWRSCGFKDAIRELAELLLSESS